MLRNKRLIVFMVIIMVSAFLMPASATDGFTVYTDESLWHNVVGIPYETEDFSDDVFNEGISVVTELSIIAILGSRLLIGVDQIRIVPIIE